jgi:hypothetical protein
MMTGNYEVLQSRLEGEFAVVSYSGGGDGYVGTWQDALHEEHFE